MLTFLTNSVTFAVAVVCFVLMRMAMNNSKNAPWWLVPTLAVMGGASLSATFIGKWAAERINNFIGPLLVGAVVLILIASIVFDLRDRKADKTARIGLIVLPILFMAGSGPLAELGNSVSGGISQAAAASIGALLGG